MTPEQVKKLWEENVRRRRRLVVSRMRATTMLGGDFGESSGGGTAPVAFTPRTFFGDGSGATDSGVWYDTSDLSTMYVDSAGLTPASVGQPVGLLLDKRLGLVRGPELNPNVDFASNITPWTSAGVTPLVTWAAGALRVENGAAAEAYGSLPVNSEANKTYEITLVIKAKSSGIAGSIQLAGGARAALTTATIGVPFTVKMAPTAAGSFTFGTGSGTLGHFIEFDSISIKELPGNHATQATTSAKPVLRQHYEVVAGASERVANGTFDTNTTGWDAVGASTVLSVVANRMRVSGTANNDRAVQTISGLTVGKTYRLEAELVAGTSANPSVVVWAMPGYTANLGSVSGAGFKSVVFVATTTTIEMWVKSDVGNADFDNISIKEVFAWRTVGAELATTTTASGTFGNFVGVVTAANVPAAAANYLVTFTISAYTSGSVRINDGGSINGTSRSAVGTYTESFPKGAGGPVVRLVTEGSGFNGSITGISVKEVSDNVGYYLEFDGVDDWLRSTFTIAQPWDRVSAVQQISWTAGDRIFSAANVNTGDLYQGGVTPQLLLLDGAAAVAANGGAAVGVNAITTERHAGASSRLAVNNGAYTTGDPGSTASDGLTIAARSAALGSAANIRFYGTVMIGRALTDAETTQVRTLLASKAGVNLNAVVTPPAQPATPQSIDLTLYGSGTTVTDQRATDGHYLIANGAVNTPNRTVGSPTALGTGDLLIEITPNENPMGYSTFSFHNAAKTAFGSIFDATQMEGIVLEGNGGGNLDVAVYKGAAYQGQANRAAGENIYVELVGTGFFVSSGTTFAGRTRRYTGTRVDAATRYFSMGGLEAANSLSKSWRVRVRAHPGG